MIRFASPEWFIFLPLLILAGWMWRRLQLRLPLRALCLALLLLVLAQPQIRRFSDGLDLWVLVDRSASAADAMARNLAEWQTLLERSKAAADRLIFVDYADVPVVRGAGTGAYSGDAQATRTGLAVQHALSKMLPDRAARLLVLSDGFSTEPLAGIGERLSAQEVPLDYRLVTQPTAIDYGVAALRVPPRAQPGEPFILELDVTGTPDGTVPFEIRRDNAPLATGSVTVRNGRGFARFTDRVTAPGAHRYTVRLKPATDARSGNDVAESWVEILGGPRLLLATAYRDDPVARTLRAQGFEVEMITDLRSLTVGHLAGAKAVLLNNVPAYELPADFLGALDLFVRVQGGGLLMAGGKSSFGSGGYFGSPLDELLPVSMELRSEHRKLAVAMAIVMDRSGSMAATVPGGATKMDLANEGAARAIDLLGARDAVSVLAVDSEPHAVVPMTTIGKDASEIGDRVRRITSGGGGIYIYNGLKAGWEELQKSDAGQRHLVLFSDAADSEEPGDYKKLIDEMSVGGATISVIGLGTELDPDAELLKDIAIRGKGRMFFNSDATSLPALFAQETVALARSAFLDEPVKLTPTAGWMELAAKPLSWLDAVDGYNLSYLKPDATAAVFSGDEYAAPLVAFWQRGAGRAAAVSFPLGGEYSQRVRDWPGYGDFAQTLARWLMGDELPPGLGLRTRVDGSELQLDLLSDDTWEEKFTQSAPQIFIADGASGEARPLVWQRLEPGHYSASMSLEPGRWFRGAVQIGKFTIPFGPIITGTNPEWTLDRERVVELQNVSRLSGGEERVDLSKVWQAPRREAFRDLRPWLLGVLLLAFLADALFTRLGWRIPEFAKMPQLVKLQKPKRPAVPIATIPTPTAPVIVVESSPPSVDHAASGAAARGERFKRAKRGGK